MNEYRSGDTNAVVLAGMCTALAVVLSVIGFYMPLVSSVVFLLIPLPIAYLGMKEGVHWSVIVTAGVMILDSVFFLSFFIFIYKFFILHPFHLIQTNILSVFFSENIIS